MYYQTYPSPLGPILLAADDLGLTGLWLPTQPHPEPDRVLSDLPVFASARAWLDVYFERRDPGPLPPLHLVGTDFQRAVWARLTAIPYGQVVTYGALARELAAARGLAALSAQAIGGAVGHNPVSVIVPCHRVVGAGGKLTGYAGGVETKAWLLALEGAR